VETIREAAAEYTARSTVRIIAQPEYEGVDFSGFPCQADHADKYETSLIMAFHPELVQMDKWSAELEIPYVYEYRENVWGYRSPRGKWKFSEDFSEQASPELGEGLAKAIVEHLKGRIEEELSRET
jgi:creatinine amidohydrolase/Fe(II)-dependent formamide hydrolase-like protein